MATTEVTPNRRGARSRESVLDAAERLMAAHGYDAATVAALVDEAGVPASSIYHYFGSKEGVLLAVMQRGAERFFEALPIPDRRIGSQDEHLAALVEAVAATLERNPNFLRILVVMATQPVNAEGGEVHRVVNSVREMALERLREQMQVVFGLDSASADADRARSLRARRGRRRLRRLPGKPAAQPRPAARAAAGGADRGCAATSPPATVLNAGDEKSGRLDLNQRPLGPQPSALPVNRCAAGCVLRLSRRVEFI